MNDEKLKYYQKLDSQNLESNTSFINLTYDIAFKSFFSRNEKFLKLFLISVLKLDMKPEETKITIANVELPKDMKKEYQKKVDVLIYLNSGNTYNIEVNKSRFKDVMLRNFIYLTKIYSSILNQGEKDSKLKKEYVCQLNLNANIKDKNKSGGTYKIKEEKTGEILTENFTIYSKNIEFYRDLYYTKNEKLKDGEMWYVVLSSRNYEEMYKTISKILNDKETIEFMDEIEKINSDSIIITQKELDMLDKIQQHETIVNALEEGEEKAKIETAKKMLDKNMSIEDITDITGLSKEEIEKLHNN